MNWKCLVALPLAALVFGCSGGGSGSGPMGSTTAASKSRFINAVPSMGNVSFQLGTANATVAPRDASPEFHPDLGTVQAIVAASGGRVATRMFTLDDHPRDFVAYEPTPGVLDVTFVDRTFTPPSGTFIEYSNFTAGLALEDIYAVPTGTPISNAVPLLATVQAGGGKNVAPGIYDIVITPAGSKTILFQSKPVTIAPDRQLMLAGVPASAHVVTPLPLILGMDPFTSLDDARPEVQIVRRTDGHDLGSPGTISIDGIVIAAGLGNAALQGEAYHLGVGTHFFDSGAGVSHTFDVASGTAYVESFGVTAPGSDVEFDTWRWPVAAGAAPAPTDKARVLLIVENCCRANAIRIDGAALAYPDQSITNTGIAFDHAPGNLQVDIFTPDGSLQEGAQAVTLQANHSYMIRIVGGPLFEGVFTYPDGRAVSRAIEVSGS